MPKPRKRRRRAKRRSGFGVLRIPPRTRIVDWKITVWKATPTLRRYEWPEERG